MRAVPVFFALTLVLALAASGDVPDPGGESEENTLHFHVAEQQKTVYLRDTPGPVIMAYNAQDSKPYAQLGMSADDWVYASYNAWHDDGANVWQVSDPGRESIVFRFKKHADTTHLATAPCGIPGISHCFDVEFVTAPDPEPGHSA